MFAWREVFTLGSDALEVVRVILEAVTRLVGVRKASVKASGLEDIFARQISSLRVRHFCVMDAVLETSRGRVWTEYVD